MRNNGHLEVYIHMRNNAHYMRNNVHYKLIMYIHMRKNGHLEVNISTVLGFETLNLQFGESKSRAPTVRTWPGAGTKKC